MYLCASGTKLYLPLDRSKRSTSFRRPRTTLALSSTVIRRRRQKISWYGISLSTALAFKRNRDHEFWDFFSLSSKLLLNLTVPSELTSYIRRKKSLDYDLELLFRALQQ